MKKWLALFHTEDGLGADSFEEETREAAYERVYNSFCQMKSRVHAIHLREVLGTEYISPNPLYARRREEQMNLARLAEEAEARELYERLKVRFEGS